MGASADRVRQLRRVLWNAPLVICGFGEVGSTVARCALSNGRLPHQVTVVEQDPRRAGVAGACGHRISNCDAISAEALQSAGASVASTVIICLGDDRVLDAVQAARSAAANASIHVVLNRSGDEQAALRAGADTVLSLSRLAGRLLADAALSDPAGNDTSNPG